MNYYLEINLLPNYEVNLFGLWSKTFQQIHLGLVETRDVQKRVPIGLSFPEYKIGEKFGVLGSKLRLLAPDETVLVQFDVGKRLSRLSDYVHFTGIRPVPSAVKGYAVYRREQPKTGKERLARRYAKRHSLDYEAVLNNKVELSIKPEIGTVSGKVLMSYGQMPHKIVTTPFIRLTSLSSGNAFCLWIKKSEMEHSNDGEFSSYGLSSTSTVPEF
ncbi:type I-F CRISPR-associated endoribonuclease Cas6/Csy4 [Nitrosomonas oligotropha]|uniref:type I-F CRISPR-associated endoribonuclease Cas6/Csy4 n=1 Tax=Nitrosomonas oligotropha TaxID=42354 RepID=UPI00136D162D|nr:type I-F CRISPR-associated endoribonuclease Cas6/Csy4 [Nitrosomonas oligotropha]MXS83964.1 type I-F CRISPR-associated endoribonuclease Cas6/Csy4 [Nitrosomonas oligotropha]